MGVVDDWDQVVWCYVWWVFDQVIIGDVGEVIGQVGFDQWQVGFYIQVCWGEQGFVQCLFGCEWCCIVLVQVGDFYDFVYQGIVI